MIGNPIIGKELITALRSRTAIALAIVYVAVLSALAVFMWPAEVVSAQEGAGVGAASLYSRLFFSVLLTAQLIMLALFSPPFSATSIIAEKERNTWEMLYYSMLRADEILLGKLVGAVTFLLVLVVLSLPLGSVCFLLGGVSIREMFTAYAILIVAGVTFGLMGLMFSALLRSSFSALISAYFGLLVLCGGVHMPLLLLPEWPEAQPILRGIRNLSPFTAVHQVAEGGGADVIASYFIFSIVLAIIMMAVVVFRVSVRPKRRAMKHASVIDADTAVSVRFMRRIFFIIDPRRRQRSIPAWSNPIFFMELRTRTAGLGNLFRATFACLVFAMGLVILVSGTWGATDPDLIRLIALAFYMGLIALIGPSLTVGSVASEVEGRTFELLRMTLLRPWTIFFGKLGASIVFSLMLVVAAAPVFFAIQGIQGVDIANFFAAMFADTRALIAMFAITCVMIIFTLSVGLFFSSMCDTTARAAAWAYGVVSLVTVGSLVGLVFRERLSAGLARFVLSFNPIVTVVGSVSDRTFAEYGVWQNNVYALGALSVVLILAAIVRLHRAVEAQA